MTTTDNENKVATSVNTLGNAADVVARVMMNIAGNDISTKLNGESMTMSAVKELAVARFTNNLDGAAQ